MKQKKRAEKNLGKRKFSLKEFALTKIILFISLFVIIMGLLLIVIASLRDIEPFGIDFGWSLIYLGIILSAIYFIIEGKPFLKSWDFMKNAKNYIWFATILFFLLALIGFLFPIFFQQQIYDLIRELLKQTEGLNVWNMIRFIFINNLKSSFFAIFCGILFGIIPFAVLVINGYVLGFVANKTIASEGALILWRLFPHGIFELPAVLISIGIGLRLGMFLFVYKEKNKLREFGKWLIDSLRVFVLIIIPLLVIAAIIEGSLMIFLG
mgnify:CR=1 FL=1